MAQGSIRFQNPDIDVTKYANEIATYYGGDVNAFLRDADDSKPPPESAAALMDQALSQASGGRPIAMHRDNLKNVSFAGGEIYKQRYLQMLDQRLRQKIAQRKLQYDMSSGKNAAYNQEQERIKQQQLAEQKRLEQEQLQQQQQAQQQAQQERVRQLRMKYRNTGRMVNVERLLAQGRSPDEVESEIQRMEQLTSQNAMNIRRNQPQTNSPIMPPAWS
jgi:hypothetical protein